jgi:hypothetical protein
MYSLNRIFDFPVTKNLYFDPDTDDTVSDRFENQPIEFLSDGDAMDVIEKFGPGMRHINDCGFSAKTAGRSNAYEAKSYAEDIPDAIDIFPNLGLEKTHKAKHCAPLISIAVIFNRVDIIEKLLEFNPAEIDRTATTGCTALHISAKNNNSGCAEYLLKKGAAVNAQDNEGNTPLHYAASKGNLALCFMLIAAGADPTIRNTKNLIAGDLIPLEVRQGR